MKNKLITSTGILLFSVLCLYFLWKQTIVLSIILILLAYIKHKMYPIKKELLWYVLISVGGAIVEVMLVNFGRAWSYTTSHFFGIPIWMPLFWGIVGTTIIVIYDGLTDKK